MTSAQDVVVVGLVVLGSLNCLPAEPRKLQRLLLPLEKKMGT